MFPFNFSTALHTRVLATGGNNASGPATRKQRTSSCDSSTTSLPIARCTSASPKCGPR